MGWYCKFLVGDFIGIGRQEIILCLGSLYGTVKFTYQSGELNYSPMSDITFSPINAKYKTGDFDGDGCTEVWCAYENHNGKIYKFIGPYYELTIVNDNFLYYDDDVFLGDFNGDGHTDFLFCTTSGNDVFNWKIWLFKSDNISYPIYNVSSFLVFLTRYHFFFYSLSSRNIIFFYFKRMKFNYYFIFTCSCIYRVLAYFSC